MLLSQYSPAMATLDQQYVTVELPMAQEYPEEFIEEFSPQIDSSDSSTACDSPETSTGCPELTAYSTVCTASPARPPPKRSANVMSKKASSFNYPQTCDQSLLTPTSLSSPMSLEFAKLSTYNGLFFAQQLSPPPSAGIFPTWGGQFDLCDGNGQLDSSAQPVPAEFYMSANRGTPGPPEPYMGSFGVSNGDPAQPTPHSVAAFYASVSSVDEDCAMDMNTQHEPNEMETNNTSDVEMSSRPENETMERERIKSSPSASIPAGEPRSASGSEKSTKKTPLPYHRVSKGTTQLIPKKPKPIVEEPPEAPVDYYEDEPPPKLKADCPEELRCLFESRWRHRRKRGADMWDSIQQDLHEKFGKNYSKEVLQMKFKRGRCRYIQWDQKDVSFAPVGPLVGCA